MIDLIYLNKKFIKYLNLVFNLKFKILKVSLIFIFLFISFPILSIIFSFKIEDNKRVLIEFLSTFAV